MAQELDDLTVDVKNTTDVEERAVVLLNGLAAKLDAAIASGDPAALVALSTSLKTGSSALAAAITADTRP